MALPDHLLGLLNPESYPHPCGRLVLIETHISWIILTGDVAYKLKKPVRFNFVDFSTLALREHYCREEVRCNRAFAPDLYLGVAAVLPDGIGGSVRMAAPGETEEDVLEWAVQMRQFDPELALDRMLARGELDENALDTFGRDLSARHAALPVLQGRPEEVPVRVFGPVEDNFEEIAGTGLVDMHRKLVADAETRARDLGQALRPAFDARMTGGMVRECHGDLHLANLALIEGRVTAFDCLEFNENLRWIDVMSDVAFLFMDCHFRGETALSYRFLDSYLDGSGDYDGVQLHHYFAAYRSVVRAKVAALRWVQTRNAGDAGRFAAHIAWSRDWLRRPPGMLAITCGLSGSGKSYLATRLLGRLPAVRLRSDVARKRLAGLDVLADSGSGIDSGIYDPVKSEETFDYLARAAEGLLLAGENVLVDATFVSRSRRDAFRALAERLAVPFVILYCQAPEEVLRSRLTARAEEGADPSEATPEVLALQQARFDPPGADEPVLTVDMAAELDDGRVRELAEAIRNLQTDAV